jgi:hypothetical protein
VPQKHDFSGSYTLKKMSGAPKQEKGEVWTLHVNQSESAIEVTRVQNGHQYLVNAGKLNFTRTGRSVSKCL